MEWETYIINITYKSSEQDSALEQRRMEITESFESELFRLVKKYQGQSGLFFDARNSESEGEPNA